MYKLRKQCFKFIKPLPLTTRTDKLIPELTSDVKIKYDRLNFNTNQLKGLDGRLTILSHFLTDLFKNERIELPYHKAEELRPYAEKIIIEAIRNGDCHKPTMELANFWIKEKQLIHKLFKVFVPRYTDFKTSFTKIYNIGIIHQSSLQKDDNFKINNCPKIGVLELKNNPLPPMPDYSQRYLNNKNNLANILLKEALKNYDGKKEKKKIDQ